MLHRDAVPAELIELLDQLSTSPALASFALGGGTSLALRFGHRVSIDLDFFTADEFDPEALQRALGLPHAQSVNRAANSLTIDHEGIKLDFLRHAYPLLEPVEIEHGIRLLSLPDVAAMKLNAIANRGSKKDFFDLAELLEHHPLNQLLVWFEEKYTDSNRFIAIRSLSWFEDAEAEPDPVSLGGLSWSKIQEIIRSAISRLG